MGFFDFLFGNKQQEGIDFKKMAKNGALLLDVRTKEEFDAGHIKGAVNIPVQILMNHIADVMAYDKEVIAYCRSGRRSGNATEILNKAGIKTVNGGGYEPLKELLEG